MTAPSGNATCNASGEADGAGWSSEKILGSTKAVSSSPPMASNNTCSPMDEAHHTRERPARQVSQLSQVVCMPPVWTRHSPSSWSTLVTMPVRMRLRIARAIYCREFKLFIREGCRRARPAAIKAGFVG